MNSPDGDAALDCVVDNDILIKAACYRLHDDLVAPRFGVLGAARFVLAARLAKMPLRGDPQAAQNAATEMLSRSQTLEPNDSELALAANLETLAQRRGLELDVGESQLTAIVAERDVPQLRTGDKRAIRALEQLLDIFAPLGPIAGRVRSLEQLVADLVERADPDDVARAICAEPAVDKALSICARCHSPAPHGPAIDHDGLASYIRQLRAEAPRVLQD